MTKKKIGRHKKTGRPESVTPAVLRKILEAYEWNATDEQAAFVAGIAPSTLYLYQKEHPEFLERKRALKSALKIHAKKNIHKSVKEEKDVTSSKWLLERTEKENYSTQVIQKSEVTHKLEVIGDTYKEIFGTQPLEVIEEGDVKELK